MPRIRSIKPEFPQSETTGRLSRDARLLFIQLWTIVDDEGRTRAASRMLASLLYPYDDDAPTLIEGWLSELERANCVRRYSVDGSAYLEIINWLKHQKIDKPSKSRLPPFDEGSAKPREASRSRDADLGPRIKDKDLGKKESARGARLAPDWALSPDDWNFTKQLGWQTEQINNEYDKFCDYWHAKTGQSATKTDWSATWRNWCRRATENKKPNGVQTRKDRIREEWDNAFTKLREYAEAPADGEPGGKIIQILPPTGSGKS